MAQDSNNLIWIDLEMTGLDTDRDKIIEIATIVTTSSLELVEEGPVLAIRQSDEDLEAMDAWNTEQHGRSGLVDRVRSSPLTEVDAQDITLNFVSKHVPANASPMCGNSVCQDRRFLHRCMPELERYFHYRNLDVSTIKELAKRWVPAVYQSFSKESSHQAMDDIRDSVRELKHYRECFFKFN